MTISRRTALAGITAGAALTTMGGCQENSASKAAPKNALPKLPEAPTSLFLNKARAADILAESQVFGGSPDAYRESIQRFLTAPAKEVIKAT